MRENRTYRLSGGRRRALRWAPPPTRHRRSGGIEPTRPRGGKGAPAGGTGGGKDGQHTEVGSRLHVTTTGSRTGQISLGDGGGHRLASWTRGYATARSEAVCRGAGCGRTRTSGSVGGQGQQRPWSTRPLRDGDGAGCEVIIPPAKTANISGHGPWSPARDRTGTVVKQLGRRRWKQVSGSHRQGRVENTCFRDTSIIGDGFRARSPAGQGSEAVLGCEILNRMTEPGRPVSYRIGR